jgi:hypothetical protein
MFNSGSELAGSAETISGVPSDHSDWTSLRGAARRAGLSPYRLLKHAAVGGEVRALVMPGVPPLYSGRDAERLRGSLG